jgi:hypothetical protein
MPLTLNPLLLRKHKAGNAVNADTKTMRTNGSAMIAAMNGVIIAQTYWANWSIKSQSGNIEADLKRFMLSG